MFGYDRYLHQSCLVRKQVERAPETPVARGKMEGRGEKRAVEEPQELSSDLARLIATERRLDQLKSETRAKADQLIEVAERECPASEPVVERECEDAAERLHTEIEAERVRCQITAVHPVLDEPKRRRRW